MAGRAPTSLVGRGKNPALLLEHYFGGRKRQAAPVKKEEVPPLKTRAVEGVEDDDDIRIVFISPEAEATRVANEERRQAIAKRKANMTKIIIVSRVERRNIRITDFFAKKQ